MIRLWLNIIDAYCRAWARPWGDPFRPPRFDAASDIAQGGTGSKVTRPNVEDGS